MLRLLSRASRPSLSLSTRWMSTLPPSVDRLDPVGFVANRTKFRGPLQACILDWSGTTADEHVLAPAVVFVDVFAKHNVPISMKEAREPMGLRKDLHIGKILEIPSVRERWTQAKGEYLAIDEHFVLCCTEQTDS